MAKSAFIDNFAFKVGGRIAPNGPLIILKVTGSEKEAKAFRDQHNERFPFGSAFIGKPDAKPVVGKHFFHKGKGRWHNGGRAMSGNA